MLARALALFTMLATGVRCSRGLQLRSASRALTTARGGKLSASSSSDAVGGPLPELAVFDLDMCGAWWTRAAAAPPPTTADHHHHHHYHYHGQK